MSKRMHTHRNVPHIHAHLKTHARAHTKHTQGFETARGVYETCYNRMGMGFQTPEAYTVSQKCNLKFELKH